MARFNCDFSNDIFVGVKVALDTNVTAAAMSIPRGASNRPQIICLEPFSWAALPSSDNACGV